MTTKETIREYKRLMSAVDMSDEVRNDIIDTCLKETMPFQLSVVPKPAIAAISGAAVIAAAFGIRKIYNFKNRP